MTGVQTCALPICKGNLDFFARGVEEIAEEISLGMKDYEVEKKHNKMFLDE